MLPANAAVVYHDPRLLSYDVLSPFAPGEKYPEYRFADAGTCGPNRVYEAVRNFLALGGFDAERFGRPEWNPLGELIQPGNTVAVKPNLVLHRNQNGGPLECVIAHASIVRAIVDYALLALKGEGTVIVGDAPLQSGDFRQICEDSGLRQVMEFYNRHAPGRVKLIDFRREHALMDDRWGVVGVEQGPGDPRGYAVAELGTASMLAPVSDRFEQYRVTNYDPARMTLHHNRENHEYLLAKSVLAADVVISVPKMKTHRKVGITGALKNCVGINGHKDWLPHHSKGSIAEGGDEYLHPSLLKAGHVALQERKDVAGSRATKQALQLGIGLLRRASEAFAPDCFFEGSWWGNDTIWRTVLDLNRALIYCDREGGLRNSPQRRLFFLVDGIIGGDGEGPVRPDPKPTGTLLGGSSAAVVDAVMARLMGFDYRKIPLVKQAFLVPELPVTRISPEQIATVSNTREFSGLDLHQAGKQFGFAPSSGWRGHIELQAAEAALDAQTA